MDRLNNKHTNSLDGLISVTLLKPFIELSDVFVRQ